MGDNTLQIILVGMTNGAIIASWPWLKKQIRRYSKVALYNSGKVIGRCHRAARAYRSRKA
ncbi:hypothetical protein TomTYG75_07240 [Sphingobium sp. TomTYG75]